MKRFALALAGLALMSFGTGCCCRHLYGNPCNPCGPAYGAAFVAPAATTAYYAPAVPVATRIDYAVPTPAY